MKIRVISEFYDKFHPSILFKEGTVVDFEEKRAQYIIDKGLGVLVETKKTNEPSKTEQPAPVVEDATADDAPQTEETKVEDAPAEETKVEDAPAEETQTEETQTDETPAADAPVEEDKTEKVEEPATEDGKTETPAEEVKDEPKAEQKPRRGRAARK